MSEDREKFYLDENEKEVEIKRQVHLKHDQQVADIWGNMLCGIVGGMGGLKLDELAEELGCEDDLVKLFEEYVSKPKQGVNNKNNS